jgi:hypothetical protein
MGYRVSGILRLSSVVSIIVFIVFIIRRTGIFDDGSQQMIDLSVRRVALCSLALRYSLHRNPVSAFSLSVSTGTGKFWFGLIDFITLGVLSAKPADFP